jgi:uncharacterized protein GlcG (DUF336 family)
MQLSTKLMTLAAAGLLFSAQQASATCAQITHTQLVNAATTAAAAKTGGYGLPMWLTFVDESGLICNVVTSGKSGALAGNSEWLGSRIISAQKANTANDFSLDGYAISTANLYAAVQPGGSLFGLQLSNPVDSSTAYLGSPSNYGTTNDPLKGKRIGGVNVFGGGLAVYKSGKKIGAIGVSGDTSCRDHAFAWNVRTALGLAPASPTVGITTYNMDASGTAQTALTGATAGDEMIINNGGTGYWLAWSHPACPNSTGLTSAQNTANGVILH